MAHLNMQELFGLKTDRKSDPKMPIVMLLKAIIGMLSDEKEEEEERTEEREIHVRPRIEPLGGG